MTPLEQFDVLMPIFRQRAQATSVDQFDQQTPCEKWVVRDLFAHMLGGATMFAAAVRGRQPAPVAPPDDDQLVDATLGALTDIDNAFREDGALSRTVASPFGDMDGETFARLLAVDLLMHTWDLSRATGQPLDVPEDVAAAVGGFAEAAISDDVRGPETFGPALPAPSGGSALDRLAAFTGRQP